MMKANKMHPLETLVLLLTILVAVGLANFLFFTRGFDGDVIIKVDSVGDTVILEYANPNESYSIDGIDNSEFSYSNGLFAFYSKDYKVASYGEAYGIIDSTGTRVATVKLQKRDPGDIYRKTLSIDLATTNVPLHKISKDYDEVRIFSSKEGATYSTSIQIEDRSESLDIIFDNVKIDAPDLAPVLYSVSDAPINITVKGNVTLEGGDNPYTVEHLSGGERFINTLDTAANAYCVCMISAIGGAASIVKGVEYYTEMFMGITSLQLNVLENAWDQVENLFFGEEGVPGLNGVPAIQVSGELNIVGDESAFLTVYGGNGSSGGDATGSFLSSPPKGGDGGKGASAIICDKLANGLSDRFKFDSGFGGLGGYGGRNVKGEEGSRGKNGDTLPIKVIFSEIDVSFNSN